MGYKMLIGEMKSKEIDGTEINQLNKLKK